MARKLDRRTVLRGMLGAAAVSVALPALEIFLNDNGDAYAGQSGFPTRFGWWFWGNGVHPEKWVPSETGTGTEWSLPPQLVAMEDVKDDITLITGMKVYLPNSVPHGSGPAGILTGGPLGVVGAEFSSSSLGGTTLDQIIAAEVGGETRFRSLEVAVERSNNSLSYAAAGQSNPPEFVPRALFERLFGTGFTAPGEEPIIDPKLALRRSVLDAVGEDARALKRRVSAADKARIDQHFDNIRGLEKQIAKLEEDPPNLASCAMPGAPLDEYPDEDGRPQMSAIHRAMADILTMALACDQTRVMSLQFSRPVSTVLYKGLPTNHHKLTHDELGDQPMVNQIVLQIMDELAYFLKALKAVPEGDGTLLDHSAILAFTDCSDAKAHAIDEYPLLIAGSADGLLKTGMHYRSPAAGNASQVGFTLLRAMGVPVTEFGADEGKVSEGLTEIES